MPPQKPDMPKRLKILEVWRKQMHIAEQSFIELGDTDSLQLFRSMKAKVEQLIEDSRAAERLDCEALEQVIKSRNYPYSIITWYKD